MFSKSLFVAILALSALSALSAVSAVSAKDNAYMTEGSMEFNQITSHLIGSWNVSHFIRSENDRGEQIGPIDKTVTVDIKKNGRGRRQGKSLLEIRFDGFNDSAANRIIESRGFNLARH